MAEKPQPVLLDLEAALIADKDHRKRDEVIEQIMVQAHDVKARLDAGMPPKQAAAFERLLHALYASHQVVRAVWRFHHSKADV